MSSHIYKNPEKYSANNALQYNFAMVVLSRISFDPDARVLDIGAGDGVITNEIAKIVTNGSVMGTDISSKMVEYAAGEYAKQPNLRFLQMDASKNIFREQFDIVTSFNCLHWVRDQEAALNGISKALVEGGQVALLLSHKKSTYHHVLDKLCASEKWRDYFRDFVSPRSFFEIDNYKQMLVSAGLKPVELIEDEMTYKYSSKEQLKGFFSAAGAQIRNIPELRKNEFLTAFADEYLKQVNCGDDEMIPVSFWCLQVIAVKPHLSLLKSEELQYCPKLFSKL